MALNRPTRLALAVLMLVAAAVLLYASGAARERGSGTTVSGDLTITWSKAKDGLAISATGFRRKSAASVSVASLPKQQVTADDTGTVKVFVALDAATAGQVGTTVVVAGRAPSNATRSLVGGVPPLDVNRSPQDALPWVIAGVLVLVAGGLAGLRPRRRVRAGGRHAGGGVRPRVVAGSGGRRRRGARQAARVRVSPVVSRAAGVSVEGSAPAHASGVGGPGVSLRPAVGSEPADAPPPVLRRATK